MTFRTGLYNLGPFNLAQSKPIFAVLANLDQKTGITEFLVKSLFLADGLALTWGATSYSE